LLKTKKATRTLFLRNHFVDLLKKTVRTLSLKGAPQQEKNSLKKRRKNSPSKTPSPFSTHLSFLDISLHKEW